jgi:hypothetical protein
MKTVKTIMNCRMVKSLGSYIELISVLAADVKIHSAQFLGRLRSNMLAKKKHHYSPESLI